MRSILAFVLALGLSLLLVVPAMSQTEDELVSQFLKKTEKIQIKKVGFVVVNGSFGRLNRDNDYNKFSVRVSPLISSVSGGTVGVDKINDSRQFFGGFGYMFSPKTSATLGFGYWLKMGSNQSGDLDLSLVNLNDPNPVYDFNLKSQVQVFAVSGQMDYYVINPPDRAGVLHALALKVGAGAGVYFASWQLWDGFTGFNIETGQPEVIGGKLTGTAPGFTAQAGVEYPVQLGGLVVEGSLRYLYLNFTGMKWYNDNNQEVVATVNNSGTRVNLNMSGPRIQLGLKRYFSW